MRSDLVFKASVHVPNRYQLTRLVSIATRVLHHPGTRIQDTMNNILDRFGHADPVAFVRHDLEPSAPASRRRRPKTTFPAKVRVERDQNSANPFVQVSGPTASFSGSLNFHELPPGVLFTTTNPMLASQHTE